MLKKTITYKEFDENATEPTTDDFWFNLTKAEVLEINLMDDLIAVGKSKDPKRIIPTFKRIIRYAVGQRIGQQFVKSEEFANAFIASDAYSELFVEILGGDDAEAKMAAFVHAVVPADVLEPQDRLPVAEKK